MKAAGVEPLLPTPPGGKTATATATDEAKARAPLEVWARGLCGTLELACYAMLGGETDIQSILQTEATEVISRWTTYQELMRRGFFGPNFDPALEAKRIELDTPKPVGNDGDGLDDATGLPMGQQPLSTEESSQLQ